MYFCVDEFEVGRRRIAKVLNTAQIAAKCPKKAFECSNMNVHYIVCLKSFENLAAIKNMIVTSTKMSW